jgi:mRNA-degrading endonuclease RelE of RelBE toxin-antitoxin system
MKYIFFWSFRARKFLEKLPFPVSQRITEKVESIDDDPYRFVERCEGHPYYHQRIGVYCAILEIDDATLMIKVHKVGLRKKVYDR